MAATYRIRTFSPDPEDTVYFVCQAPDIRFTSNAEEALLLPQEQALDTINNLMTMQRTSSYTKTESYGFECVKK